jgi:tRNA 2-selenouridine synthase
MIHVLNSAAPADLAGFDAVIDVRSPAEFAEDHLPGAINLPVLSDEERARVGTIYVQDSPFKARKLGGAIVARNIAHHLETALADKPASFHPLVYCWRGGQRSNSMATILSAVGWRTGLLNGGYRTYRRAVNAALYGEVLPHRLVLIDGGTGTGKTALLHALAARGVQVLDLEGLAEHRGSLFGALPGRPQPSQKMFESRLHAAVAALDPARPVAVEAESSKIGECFTPPAVWAAMQTAPRIELVAPLAARVDFLLTAYADIAEDRAALHALLARLPRHLAAEQIKAWRTMVDAGEMAALAAGLIEAHYDPAYRRGAAKAGVEPAGRVEVAALTAVGIEAAADEAARLVGVLGGG